MDGAVVEFAFLSKYPPQSVFSLLSRRKRKTCQHEPMNYNWSLYNTEYQTYNRKEIQRKGRNFYY